MESGGGRGDLSFGRQMVGTGGECGCEEEGRGGRDVIAINRG